MYLYDCGFWIVWCFYVYLSKKKKKKKKTVWCFYVCIMMVVTCSFLLTSFQEILQLHENRFFGELALERFLIFVESTFAL